MRGLSRNIIDVLATYPQDEAYDDIIRIARERLELNIAIEPPGDLPAPRPKPFFSILDQILSEEITRQVRLPFWIDTVGNSKIVEIRLRLDDGVLRVFAPRNSAYASNTHIFLIWMVGTSLVLLVIAVLFLRNQIRPIQALAAAADEFGRGKPMPSDFRPRGASEVRQASVAFIQMRDRIERQIEQRTRMLSGVSHDLRTVLTRFRLQLALLGEGEDQDELNADIDEMLEKISDGERELASVPVEFAGGLVAAVPGGPGFRVSDPGAAATAIRSEMEGARG